MIFVGKQIAEERMNNIREAGKALAFINFVVSPQKQSINWTVGIAGTKGASRLHK